MEFRNEEFREVIENLQPKEARGKYGVTNEIVKLVFKDIPNKITANYNACLRIGCFPDTWKITKMLPLYKPGREISTVTKKYRPIILPNTEREILENLLSK